MPPPPSRDDHSDDDSELASQNDQNTVKILSGRKSACQSDCLYGGVVSDEAIGSIYNPDATKADDKYAFRRRIFKNTAVKQCLNFNNNGKISEPLDKFLKEAAYNELIKRRNCDCNMDVVERSCNSGGSTINVDRMDLLQMIFTPSFESMTYKIINTY